MNNISSEDKKGVERTGSAGFSDIFANIATPANEDLPISTSTGSLVDIAKPNDNYANIPKSGSHSSSSHSLSSLNEQEKRSDADMKSNMGPPSIPPTSSSRPSLPPRQSSSNSEKSAGGTPDDTSAASTPRREMPPPPKRSAPPPLPPTTRGPPPALPTRPPSGPPPPVPKR
jgi:hypothetical protein